MAAPSRYLLDALRKLRGDALVTYPDKALGVRRVERVFSVARNAAPDAFNSPQAEEYTDTELVDQQVIGGDHQFVEWYQAWETLPGSELTTKIRRSPTIFDAIPVEFKIGLSESLDVIDQTVEPEQAPDAITGNVIESIVNQESKSKAHRKTTSRTNDTNYPTLHDKSTTAEKLFASTDRKVITAGTSIAAPTARTSVELRDIGGGKQLEAVTTVPIVFPAARYAVNKPEITPEKFRSAVPTETTETTSEGTASMPALAAGELSASSEQRDAFTRRDSLTTRSPAALPISLVASVLTPQGQVASVIEKLDNGVQTITPDAGGLTLDAEVTNLGDGTSVRKLVTAPSLFTKATFETERPDVLPREFEALLQKRETGSIAAGTAAQPTLGSGDLKATEEQLTVQLKKTTRVNRDLASLPLVLTGKETDKDGQIVTVTKTLKNPGGDPVPSATKRVRVEAVGDGTKVQVEEDIPGVFDSAEYTSERPNTVPLIFRHAIPTVTVRQDSAGAASAPTLSGAQLRQRQTNLTAFTRRIETDTQADPTLPVVLNAGHETNADKQDVTVTKRFLESGSAVTAPSAVTDVEVEETGGGRKVETIKTRPSVLARNVFSKRIPDDIPSEFTAVFPLEKTTTEDTTPASSPTLGTGDLEREETQINAFVARHERTFRSGFTYPRDLTDKVWDGINADGMNFGGAVAISRRLHNVDMPIDQGLTTLSSKVKDIGGRQIRETAVLSGGFPTATDDIVDPVTGFRETRTKQILAAGTAHPGGFVDQRQIDNQRLLRVTRTANTASLDAYVCKFEGTTNIDFPVELVSLTGLVEGSFANGDYGENGFTNMEGQVTGGLAAKGSSEGSAATSHEVDYAVRRLSGSNAPCTHLLFFVPSGFTRAQILSKLSGASFYGQAIKDWPRWCPQEASLVCTGSRVAITQRGSAAVSSGVRAKYDGTIAGAQVARAAGWGNSSDISISTKVLRLSATIHGLISVGGSTFAQQSCTAFTSIQLGVIGTSAGVATGTAGSRITPTSLAATPGNTVLQTNDHRLYRIYAEPHTGGYVKMHAEVVNMAILDDAVT